MTLYWNTSGDGTLFSAIGGYQVTVERLIPAAEARFVIWGPENNPTARSSGVRGCTKDAMEAAEEALNQILANQGKAHGKVRSLAIP